MHVAHYYHSSVLLDETFAAQYTISAAQALDWQCKSRLLQSSVNWPPRWQIRFEFTPGKLQMSISLFQSNSTNIERVHKNYLLWMNPLGQSVISWIPQNNVCAEPKLHSSFIVTNRGYVYILGVRFAKVGFNQTGWLEIWIICPVWISTGEVSKHAFILTPPLYFFLRLTVGRHLLCSTSIIIFLWSILLWGLCIN